MAVKILNVVVDYPTPITALNLIKNINKIQPQLIVFIGDISENPENSSIVNALNESKGIRFKFLCQGLKFSKSRELIEKLSEKVDLVEISMPGLKIDKNVDKILKNEKMPYGIKFRVDVDSMDLLYELKIPSTSVYTRFETGDGFSVDKLKELYKFYLELEGKWSNVITDKDEFFHADQNFDCPYYSEETMTMLANGDICLCPDFLDKSSFRVGCHMGNIDMGLDRLSSRIQNTKKVNTAVIRLKNVHGLTECEKCHNFFKK